MALLIMIAFNFRDSDKESERENKETIAWIINLPGKIDRSASKHQRSTMKTNKKSSFGIPCFLPLFFHLTHIHALFLSLSDTFT